MKFTKRNSALYTQEGLNLTSTLSLGVCTLVGITKFLPLDSIKGFKKDFSTVDRHLQNKYRVTNRYLITPKRKALLNTIRYAEGTWKNGKDLGYRTIYGGGLFKDLSKHPNKIIVKKYASAAAGAYQFIPTTWKAIANDLRLTSFQPHHQDQAAIHLVRQRGVLGEIDTHGLTIKAIAHLSKEWASFPNEAGQSAYGQPVKTYEELTIFYSKNLRDLRTGV